MTGDRIVGSVVRVDPDNIRRFFQQRVSRVDSDEPLTSVLYQDHDPALARARDAAEKERLLPLLHLRPGTRTLDVACGIGRWATPLIDLGAEYVGVDFAEGLLEEAKRTEPRGTFIRRDIAAMTDADITLWDPQCVLVCGALLYLNDDAVSRLADVVSNGIQGPGRVLLREPTAVEERLTLQDVESSELRTSYTAIYRTRDELLQLFGQPFVDRGFSLRQDHDLFDGNLNNRAETRQRFYLWERTA